MLGVSDGRSRMLTQTEVAGVYNGDEARAARTLADYFAAPDIETAKRSERDALRALGNALLFMIGEDDRIEWLNSTKGAFAASIVEALKDAHEMEHAQAVRMLALFIWGDPTVCDYILTALDNVVMWEDAEGYDEAHALARAA